MNTKNNSKKSKAGSSGKAEWEGFFVNRYWLLLFELDFITKRARYLRELEPNAENVNTSRIGKKELVNIKEKKAQLIKKIRQAAKQLMKSKSKCGLSVLLPYENIDQIDKLVERVASGDIGGTTGAWPTRSSRLEEHIASISRENSCPVSYGYVSPCHYSINNNIQAGGEENTLDESGAEWDVEWNIESNHGLATFEVNLYNPSNRDIFYYGTASFVYWRLPKPKCNGTLTLYINVYHSIFFNGMAYLDDDVGGCSSYVSCCVSDSNGMLHPSPHLEVLQPWSSESSFESGIKRLVITKSVEKDAEVLVGLSHILYLAVLGGWANINGSVATSHPTGNQLAPPRLQYNFIPAEPPM